MYNIFIILNSAYIVFGKIFLGSLYRKVDLSKIDKIFIGDTGLNDSDKRFLSTYDKVVFYDTKINTNFKRGLHAPEWHENINCKTEILKKIVQDTKKTTILMDADMMFLKDIYPIIDKEYDIQVCFRFGVLGSSPYLASFFVANNPEKVSGFIDRWKQEMDDIGFVEFGKSKRYFPRESHALTRTISKFSSDYKIKIEKGEEISSTPEQYIKNFDTGKTKIIHFKSDLSVYKEGRFFHFERMKKSKDENNNFKEILEIMNDILEEKR